MTMQTASMALCTSSFSIDRPSAGSGSLLHHSDRWSRAGDYSDECITVSNSYSELSAIVSAGGSISRRERCILSLVCGPKIDSRGCGIRV